MKVWKIFPLVFILLFLLFVDKGKDSKKKSMLGFHTAITCNNPGVNVLKSYAYYGCYCGVSGYGKPLDETDKCCQVHDKCYGKESKRKEEEASKSGYMYKMLVKMQALTSFMLESYSYSCENGSFVCKEGSGNEICNCDREASICFAKHYHSFQRHLINISREVYCKSNFSYHDLRLYIANQTKHEVVTVLPESPTTNMNILTKIEKKQMTNKDKKEEKLLKNQENLLIKSTNRPMFSIKNDSNVENEKTKLDEKTGINKKASADKEMTKTSVKAISLIVVAVILFIVFLLVNGKRQTKMLSNKKESRINQNRIYTKV